MNRSSLHRTILADGLAHGLAHGLTGGRALASALRASAGVLAAFLLLVPCAYLRAGDGVGVDGMIGSLPQRRGPNGECFFNGIAASFVPLGGTFWGQVPTAPAVLVFEGREAAIRGAVSSVRREAGRTQIAIDDERIAQVHGCSLDFAVDFQRLAAAGVNSYLQLPSSYSLMSVASAFSTNGVVLSQPVVANARHYYLNLAYIVRLMGQLWLPDVELVFADGQGQILRAHFSLEAGSLLRVRIS